MYEAHQAFLNWSSGYDDGRYEGRCYRSQKSFLTLLKAKGVKVLEIETPLPFTEELSQVQKFIQEG
jgi:hypothetical protein